MERWREGWEEVASRLAETDRAIQVEEARIEQLSAQRERLERERQKIEAERAAVTSEELEQRLDSLVGGEQALVPACEEAVRSLSYATDQIQQLREQE
jgi:chromosome segregation ATPase